MVSARRGWGTQRPNPEAPAAQRLCLSTRSAETAPSGPPLGPLMHSVELPVRPRSQPWGPCGIAPLFVCAQGIPRPVGHRWGPCRAGHLGLTHTET